MTTTRPTLGDSMTHVTSVPATRAEQKLLVRSSTISGMKTEKKTNPTFVLLWLGFVGFFIFSQFAGVLGYIFGFEGRYVIHDGWSGYFIAIGLASLVITLLVIVMGAANFVLTAVENKTRS